MIKVGELGSHSGGFYWVYPMEIQRNRTSVMRQGRELKAIK